jgi:hypothetical protein
MRIGNLLGLGTRAQAAADLDAGNARQHPVEDDEIGHIFADARFRVVAAVDDIHVETFAFEIVAQQEIERLLVLDNHDARFHGSRPQLGRLILAMLVVSSFGRSSVSGSPMTR